MAIQPGLCVSAKADLWSGVHQPGDEYRLALYSEDAILSPFDEHYTPKGEVKGKGYPAGGVVLTGRQVTVTGLKATIGWTDPVLVRNATISARGAVIYNASKQGRIVGIVDFGQQIISTNGNFKVDASDLFWIA